MRRLLAAVLIFAACSTPPAPTPDETIPNRPSSSPASPSPTPNAPFDLDAAMSHIRQLAGVIGTRVAGTPGEEAAASYIEQQMMKSGLQVSRQGFIRADGGASVNVIGRFPGVDYASGYWLAGGHYDTKGNSPGANDNASGIALMLELARALKLEGRPIEFVAFAAEEVSPTSGKNHEGSSFYVSQMSDRGAPKGMVSLDMIGNGERLHLVSLKGHDASLRDELLRLSDPLGVPAVSEARGNISDHGPFAKAGVPSCLVWSGHHPSVHTEKDTLEVIQPDSLMRAARLIFDWSRSR